MSTAHAEFMSGNHLKENLDECSNGNNAKCIYGMGYTIGFIDSSPIAQDIPAGVNVGQLTAIASLYMKKHPEQLHELATKILYRAFREVFPAKKAPESVQQKPKQSPKAKVY